MNNNNKWKELLKELDAIRNRVENIKRELERRERERDIFVSSIPDDHIPVDHY